MCVCWSRWGVPARGVPTAAARANGFRGRSSSRHWVPCLSPSTTDYPKRMTRESSPSIGGAAGGRLDGASRWRRRRRLPNRQPARTQGLFNGQGAGISDECSEAWLFDSIGLAFPLLMRLLAEKKENEGRSLGVVRVVAARVVAAEARVRARVLKNDDGWGKSDVFCRSFSLSAAGRKRRLVLLAIWYVSIQVRRM